MSVGVVLPVVVPVAGEERTGAAGGGGGVVNDHADDQPRQPVTPVAFTRQKYWVVPARTGAVNDTAVVPWFTTVVANVLTVLTWSVYESAPAEAPQESVGVSVETVLAFAGKARTGTNGGWEMAGVTSVPTDDQGDGADPFAAFTRQYQGVFPAREGTVMDVSVVAWFTTVVANALSGLTWTVYDVASAASTQDRSLPLVGSMFTRKTSPRGSVMPVRR